jgi:YidC/Oxa1 family membrane protein insertase
MEKRVFLAIFLSFVVLAIYQSLFAPPPPPPPAGTRTEPAQQGAGTVGGGPPAAGEPPAPPQTATSTAPAVATLVGDTQARDIVVETDWVRAVFTTGGATLKSWQLKDYLHEGEPLELVGQDVPTSIPRPFTLSTDDPAISQTLATALFEPSADMLALGTTPGQLSFEYRDESGLSARKTFYFQPEQKPYVLKVEATVDQAGSSRAVKLTSGPAIGQGLQAEGWSAITPRAVLHDDGKMQRLPADDLQTTTRFEGDIRFAGVEDQYFLNAVLLGGQTGIVHYEPLNLPAEGETPRTFVSYVVSVPGSFSLPYFIGPKDFDVLRGVDPRLELVRAIDFGMFAPIVVPLLQALKGVNRLLGNYGWSIVVLTVIINVAIFPLRHRSMVSMKKMQALQPEVKAIQERYAKYKLTDPERQKMNQEMMGLYKSKGVNPASGCVPMLLTLPILFAFYAMLSAAIELRGAPFLGWIRDLSQHDPLYITPVLMGLSMLWQQRMMPTTADPMQQRIFLLMPIIFTVSFLWAPAGLVVYWFVSNLLAIGQQYLTNRMIGGSTPAPARAAAAPAVARPAKSGNGGGRKS